MYTKKILIVALVSVLEIVSSNVSIDRQIHLRSPSSQRTRTDAISPEKNFVMQKYQNPPKKYHRKIKPASHRYHGKKNYCRLDPIEYKKQSRNPDRLLCYLKKSKKTYPIDKWNDPIEETRKTKNLDSPSIYLKPPKITDNDYQYYERRDSLKNRPEQSTRNLAAGRPKSHRPKNETTVDENNYDSRPAYIRDHAPQQQAEATTDEETIEQESGSNEEPKDSPRVPKDRIEFHLHGHAGPETYMFGFDTGDGENRQYRMEERHEDGTVTGHYGYIDARGKLRNVRYKASPTLGYEEKHHETNGQE